MRSNNRSLRISAALPIDLLGFLGLANHQFIYYLATRDAGEPLEVCAAGKLVAAVQ